MIGLSQATAHQTEGIIFFTFSGLSFLRKVSVSLQPENRIWFTAKPYIHLMAFESAQLIVIYATDLTVKFWLYKFLLWLPSQIWRRRRLCQFITECFALFHLCYDRRRTYRFMRSRPSWPVSTNSCLLADAECARESIDSRLCLKANRY